MSAVSLNLLAMCSYGYDSLPLESGGTGGTSFAGMAQGGNLGSGGTLGQLGGAGGTVASLGGQMAGGGMASGVGGTGASTGGTASGGTGGVASGGTGGAASGGTGGVASGGTAGVTASGGIGGAASGGTGGVASGGTAGVTNGLVGYWKLDEPDTTGVAQDSSGNGNHGIYDSIPDPLVSSATPPVVQFADPYCLDAFGTVKIPYTSNYAWTTTSSFTLSAWAYVPALTGSWRAVVTHEYIAQPNFDYCGIWLNPINEWSFEPNTKRGAVAPAAVGWHHVAAVQDGTANIRKIYVDGVLSAKTDTAVNCNNLADYRIGAADEGTSDFWSGRIDDVRLYNRALSAAEVTSLAAGN